MRRIGLFLLTNLAVILVLGTVLRLLGVDHYLGKPYAEDELLGLLRHYCAVPVQAEVPA